MFYEAKTYTEQFTTKTKVGNRSQQNHCSFELFTFAISQIKYIADISLLLKGNFPTRSYPTYSSPFGSVAYVCIKHFAFLFVSHLHAISDVLLTITGICNGALKFPQTKIPKAEAHLRFLSDNAFFNECCQFLYVLYFIRLLKFSTSFVKLPV